MKKNFLYILAFACIIMLISCKKTVTSVYFLNFKPEQDAAWQELAKEYNKQTGVSVRVVTAAQGRYEETLAAELDKTNSPTLFQVSGQVAFQTWKDYCLDLTDSKVYAELISDDFAIKDSERVYGIAYVYEGYGLVVNKRLLKDAGYEISDITSFAKLKEVAEAITANKDTKGYGAFTSSGLDSSSSWRFSGHLANLPLYYEFKDDNISSQPATIKGTYLANFRNIWDLYINNTFDTNPVQLSSKTGDNALAEFKTEKAVFYQNGTWIYEDVKSMGDENLGFIPIYFGVDDEKMGFCRGTENYWVVNSRVSEERQQATLDFLEWIVTSETGINFLANKMEFVSPFKLAKKTNNLFYNIMDEYAEAGYYNVDWTFNYTPNAASWRQPVVDALAAYSANQTLANWNALERAFVKGWETQYNLSHQK